MISASTRSSWSRTAGRRMVEKRTNGNASRPVPWLGPHKTTMHGREILRLASRASIDFGLIEPGDRILAAVSGGKDSSTLAWALNEIRRRVPFSFEFSAVNVDMGFGGFDQETVGSFLEAQGLKVELVREKAGDICRSKLGEDGGVCWLCARLRRGILYARASKLGFNKIALGHHADDCIETLLMNQFFSGQIKAMPPKLFADNGRNVVIRPLIYVFEKTIADFAREMRFPIVYCNCPYAADLTRGQRSETKRLLDELSRRIPDVKNNILASLTRVRPSHLMDRDLVENDKKTRTENRRKS